jgi:acetolactate synthase-1/2/3 large subunit
VDIDASEIGKNYPATLGVVCDVKLFLSKLLELTVGVEITREKFLNQIEALKTKRSLRYRDKLTSDSVPLKPQRLMMELNNALPKSSVVVCDSGNNAWWPMMFLESREDRRFIFPSGNVSMGFAFPAALGARCVADKVVCITGDGGFMMQLAELATSRQERLNVPIILLNDGGFGAVRHYQRFNFGRYVGVDLQNPDFTRLASAFGLDGARVETPKELSSGITEAFKSRDSFLLEVVVDPDEVALPDWIIQSFGGKLS